MSSELPSPPAKALASWKEIARFFDREVRTVQRWEKEEGLPVHRHRHQRQSSVYAYKEELEAWWRERGIRLTESNPDSIPVPERTVSNRKLVWAASLASLLLVLVAVAWAVHGRRATEDAPPFRAVVFEAGTPNARLQSPVTADVNGDGVDDILVSAWTGHGAYILFGGAQGLGGGSLPAVANVVIQWPRGGQLGIMHAADYNGDGIKDLLFTEYLEEPESYTATGKSFIVWGRTRWPGTLNLPEAADVTLELKWPTDARMGACRSSGAGSDLNNDGLADVFLGAVDYGFGDRKSSGAVFVLWGRKKWPRTLEVSAAADVTIRGSRTGEGLGGTCTLGDMDGDGKADLTVFASEATLWAMLGARGRYLVFYGRDSWPRVLEAGSDPDFVIAGARSYSAGGPALLADVNGDHYDDLVASWPLDHTKGREDPDEVQIWFGGARRKGTLPATAADVSIHSTEPKLGFGGALAARDFDGDGIPDLVVSEPRRASLYLLYGRKDWSRSGRLTDYSPVILFRDRPVVGNYLIATADTDGDALPEVLFTTVGPDDGPDPRPERMWVLKPYVAVALDVRPEKEQNVVLWPGVVVVRLQTSSRDKAESEIDPATLRLAGAPVTRWVAQDYNGDGFPDLQANFDTSAMSINLSTKVVAVTARTRAGLPVGGTDVITVVATDSVAGEKRTTAGSGANP